MFKMIRHASACYNLIVIILVITLQSVKSTQVCTDPVETNLSFDNAKVLRSDLLNGGEIRYGNIGNVRGAPVELKITARSYKTNFNGNPNGLKGKFGSIGLETVQGVQNSGRATFTFCFVQPRTNSPVTVDSFRWYVQ